MFNLKFLTPANQITIVRILLIFPFVICLLQTGDEEVGHWMRLSAVLIFALMAASDAFDGYWARKNQQVSPLGAFLDPMADKLMITCACVILAAGQTAVKGFQLPLTVVVLIIGKDVLLLLGFVITYFLTGKTHIRPVWVGKASTFLQILMVFSVLIGPEMTNWIPFWPIIARCFWWLAAICAAMATFVYIYRGILYIEAFDSIKSDQDSNG